MEKERYEYAEMEVIRFSSEDVILASGCGTNTCNVETPEDNL